MRSDEHAARPRPMTVSLAGSTYTSKTDASEEYVGRLEQYVNDKLDLVQPGSQRLAPRTAFALAALSIADDFFSAEGKRAELEDAVRDRLERLVTRIDAVLAAGSDE